MSQVWEVDGETLETVKALAVRAGDDQGGDAVSDPSDLSPRGRPEAWGRGRTTAPAGGTATRTRVIPPMTGRRLTASTIFLMNTGT